MGWRRLLLATLLLLFMAAGAAFPISRAAPAFGVKTGWPPEGCLRCYDSDTTMPPFVLGAAAAIHLGNTNSCIAGYGHAGPGPGPGARPNYYQFCIPSWVAIAGDGTILSGEAAMNHAASSPRAAISAFMRLLDQRVEDDVVKREMGLVPYKFNKMLGWASPSLQLEDTHGDPAGRNSPSPISPASSSPTSTISPASSSPTSRRWRRRTWAARSTMLSSPHQVASATPPMARRASAWRRGGTPVSVPSRSSTSTSRAAAAYGHHTTQGDRKAILVFHLGGRTSHATIFKFVDGTARLIDTIVDHFLGGDDFTATIVDHLAELIKKQHGRDVRQDKAAMARLKVACEQAKRALSEQQETLVQIDSLLDDGVVFSAPLTRADFEELNHHLFHRALGLVEEVVKGRVEMVDEIVVVGGSARIPKVRRLLRDYFHGRRPNSRKGVEPEEAVVHGAALLARPVAVVQPQAARDLEVEEDSHSSLDFDHWFRGATDKRVYKV